MAESPDTPAEVVGPSRGEYVRHVLDTARETLERTRARDESEFRERPVESPARTPPARPRLDTSIPTWEQDRASVLEAIQTWADERAVVLEVIRGLRELCEALSQGRIRVSGDDR